MFNVNKQLNLEIIECCECGILFAINKDFQNKLRETKQTFFCPNGHSQLYARSTAAILREEIGRKNNVIEELENKNIVLEKKLKPKKKKKIIKKVK